MISSTPTPLPSPTATLPASTPTPLPSPTAPLPTPTASPIPNATHTANGLVIVVNELAAEPSLDPLSFMTIDDKYGPFTSLPTGDIFPDRSYFQDMHFSISSDFEGAHLVAMEDSTGLENGFVTLTRDGEEIFRISTGHGSPIEALRGLWTYDQHWVLETAFVTYKIENNMAQVDARGQIVQDGQALSDLYGYEEAFGFQTIQGRPFYFFKKAGRIDAWYDGLVIPLGFDTIPNYGCCSSAELNPRRYTGGVIFFGTRGKTWYFVQISTSASLR